MLYKKAFRAQAWDGPFQNQTQKLLTYSSFIWLLYFSFSLGQGWLFCCGRTWGSTPFLWGNILEWLQNSTSIQTKILNYKIVSYIDRYSRLLKLYFYVLYITIFPKLTGKQSASPGNKPSTNKIHENLNIEACVVIVKLLNTWSAWEKIF